MPEYLQRRFGGERLRIYLSIIALVTYLFAILSVSKLYCKAIFLYCCLDCLSCPTNAIEN